MTEHPADEASPSPDSIPAASGESTREAAHEATHEATHESSADVAAEPGDLFGISRDVRSHSDLRGGLLSVSGTRNYPVSADRLWGALTDPEQLRRWFLPVSGDLRPGGEFQAEGNAGGEIRKCEPGKLLRLTWGDDSSIVELRLQAGPDGDASTVLELVHTVPMELAGNGTGAFYVGPGWDFALHALAAYLADEPLITPGSRAEQVFNKQSLLAWALVVDASATATPDEVVEAVTATLPQWAPDLWSTAASGRVKVNRCRPPLTAAEAYPVP